LNKNFEERYQKRKLLSTYFSVVLINIIVVFLTGILGLLLFNSNKVANHFKEQIALTVYFKDSSRDIEIKQVQKSIQFQETTKSVIYTSKEEAAKIYANEIGEDYMEFLGYNPLESSLDIYFNADYVKPQIIKKISDDLLKYQYISEVTYDQPLLELLDENIKKIEFWILLSCFVFVLVAVLLINSSIRLSIYSKRFAIKTMQLVGATKWFIQKPFLRIYFNLSLFSSVSSIIVLYLIFKKIQENFPELNLLQERLSIILILSFVFAFGIIITLISTFFATKRFLNLKSDEIY
jgi:cell division transport system permease protein|tara:strand:- start:2023 stop:2901 length:879 start_codon:yes stop_codon:yes gene_type:complete